MKASRAADPPTRRERELTLLFNISRALEGSMDLRDVVGPVLEALADEMGMSRGTLTLLNRETGAFLDEVTEGGRKLQ